MGHRILAGVVAAAVGLLVAGGCSQFPLIGREPGPKLMTFPGEVAEEYTCSKRNLPFFKIEETVLTPHKIKPGNKLNHRFIYVMCPSQASGVIPGTLYTRIRFRGETVYTNVTDHELQPGRWAVDATIRLPERAASGIYAIEARFQSKRGGFNAKSDFLVR